MFVWRRGGLNLGVPEFSFERNEIVNELIKKKKKRNGWAERKGITPRLFNVLCQSEKWFTPRLFIPRHIERQCASLVYLRTRSRMHACVGPYIYIYIYIMVNSLEFIGHRYGKHRLLLHASLRSTSFVHVAHPSGSFSAPDSAGKVHSLHLFHDFFNNVFMQFPATFFLIC